MGKLLGNMKLRSVENRMLRMMAPMDKVYPIIDAIEVMDKLMEPDTRSNSLDDDMNMFRINHSYITYQSFDSKFRFLYPNTPPVYPQP